MHTPLRTQSEVSHAARYEALLRVLHMLTTQRDPTALFRVLASELRHMVTCDGISLPSMTQRCASSISTHLR
jgi:hypothetical protein